MEPHLRFYLFGPFEVWRDGECLSAAVWRTRKHAALLKILLGQRGRVVPADRLVEWLWPDLPPSSGQANLYVAISLLRRVLEPGLAAPAASSYILTSHPGYLFEPSAACWIDVDRFQAHCSEARAHLRRGEPGSARRAYDAAAALYRGDYLDDNPYEDWAIGPREWLREEYLGVLDQLHHLCLSAGDAAAALAWARQALALDPCREGAHRQVMRAYYALGRQADALRQFHRCRDILHSELGVEPMPSTLLLHQQILYGQMELVAEAGVAQPSPGRLVFVGRQAELATLQALLDRVRRDGCRVALVSGEAGVGKTRLIEEFAAGTHLQGMTLLHAACHALDRDMPYQPLREALSGALSGALSVADLAALVCDLGPWAGVVAGLVPALWEQCPGLVPPPPLAPAEERARLLHGLARLVQALAAAGPLILFVDDLHWADGSTLQALHYLATHVDDSPVLLLGAYRTGEASDTPERSLEQLLASLRREGRLADQPHESRLTEIVLRRLTQAEVAALVAAMARSPHGGRLFSRRLYRETEGNPLFLAEILRALFEQGVLYHDDLGAWATDFDDITEAYEELPIPATVREVVLGRFRQLPPRQQQALAAASVIGRAFGFELWLQAAAADRAGLVETLEHCLARQLLVRRADGRYDFSHALLREILFRELAPERRVILHRRLAEALAGREAESLAGEIAHHYLEAGMWAPALDRLEQAGHAALRLFAHQEAWPHFSRAYTVLDRLGGGPPQRRYAIVQQLYHLCSVLGRRDKAGAFMDEALALACELEDPARIGETLQALCRHHFVGGQVPRALELSQEAVDLSRQAGDARQEAHALRQHGYLCYRAGQHDEAFAALDEALRLSRSVGDLQIEAQNLNVLGVVHYYHGDYARALALWEAALPICRQIDFKPVLAQVAGNLGEVYRAMGRYPQALAYRQEGLDVAQAIGFRTIEPDGLLDLGLTCSDLGRHGDAVSFVQEALALARQVGHRHFVVDALNGLARVHLRIGGEEQAGQALALAREAQAEARELGLHHGQMMALSLQGRALLVRGQVDLACEASQAAIDLLEAHSIAEGDEPSVYYHHARCLLARGDTVAVRVYLYRAWAEVEAKAARITDPDLRASFLQNVPVNRAIALALAGRES